MPNEKIRDRRLRETRKGQVLIIFALTALVLFAVMGLAIDAGVSYLHSDLQARAADAAALSGVSYLPGDSTDATSEALLTAQRDGYTNAGACPRSTKVTVSQPANNQLEVSITALAPVYFLGLLGFGSHCVTAYATAEYLPPIQLGQPGSALGSPLGANGLGSGGNNFYFLRTEGWGNPRSEGDAFTPTPTENNTGCGTGACSANYPDVHQISCEDGTDTCNGTDGLQVNANGGYSYLIYVPGGTSADVQVYNPSFDPGTDSNSNPNIYTYHDDDSSFPLETSYNTSLSTIPATDYGSMGFTLYAVPQLYSRSSDVPLLQDIFCPFNAYGFESSSPTHNYSYIEATNSKSKTISGCNPNLTSAQSASPTLTSVTSSSASQIQSGVWQQYVSLINYPATTTGDAANLVYQDSNATLSTNLAQYETSGKLTGGTSGGPGQYYRLRVDSLSWWGAAIDETTPPDSSKANTYPLAHDGYSLQLKGPSGGSCGACTVSAMGDMALYTPIDGATQPSFQVPLFYLPSSYAGKDIAVSVFDPGDVTGGAAYLGIQGPCTGSTLLTCNAPFASMASNFVQDLGTSLHGTGGGAPTTTNVSPSDSGTPISANSAVVCTATCTPSFNGDWVQFTIAVPNNYAPTAAFNSGYWNLYYHVLSGTSADDTITVAVQYLGSPLHLLPNP
jgi:hypothetical protein